MDELDREIWVNDIFTSFQGEGRFLGTKCLFIRLSGCPLRCYYCDQPEALLPRSGTKYSISSLAEEIESVHLQPNTYKLSLTGGEPLLQHLSLIELCKAIRHLVPRIYLESSCYNPVRFNLLLPHIDLVKIEFKMRDAQAVHRSEYQRLLQSEFECLGASLEAGKDTFIKVVVTKNTSLEEFTGLVERVFTSVPGKLLNGFVIQPAWACDSPTPEMLMSMYDVVYPRYEDVRVMPQAHKILGMK